MAHGPGRLGALKAPWLDSSARASQEAPELFHLHDPLEGRPHRLGVGGYSEGGTSPTDRGLVHEERFALVPAGPAGPASWHRHMLGIWQAYVKETPDPMARDRSAG